MKKNLLFICCFLVIIYTQAQKSWVGDQKLYYGASYYPEAWPEKNIDTDIKLMKEANINVVRMAEFSWSKLEPKEGVYDFVWLRQVIEKLDKNGIQTILCTPTATPPAWMLEKYPSILLQDPNGRKAVHGIRRDGSFSSQMYRDKNKAVIEAMSKALGQQKGVIAWQTDNEISLNFDYSQETKTKWHAWLKKTYTHIDKINTLWNTHLWSQYYDRIEQIPMPDLERWHHPSLKNAWVNFTQDEVYAFHKEQIAAIRKHSSLPITHDATPSSTVNFERIFKDCDFTTTNVYHSFEAFERIPMYWDRLRGLKRGMSWLFETAPNFSGGGDNGSTWFIHQPEGSVRADLWMNWASGGQGCMFWLWKQHSAGQEMPHGAFLSPYGKPLANWSALQKIGQELPLVSPFLMSNPVQQAKIGLFFSYESMSGLKYEKWANGLNYMPDFTSRFYVPLFEQYWHRDVVMPAQKDLQNYQLLIMPLMPYIPDSTKMRLKQWVENGGTLILGPMSGYRNQEWAANTDYQAGDLEPWMGIITENRLPIGVSIREKEIPTMLSWKEALLPQNSQAFLVSDALSSSKGKVLATYDGLVMQKGSPAIIENQVGKGKVVVLGTDPGKKAYQALIAKYATEKQIKPLATGDEGVLVVPRKGAKESGWVLVNITAQTKNIQLQDLDNVAYQDLLTSTPVQGNKIVLAPFEVKVLRRK